MSLAIRMSRVSALVGGYYPRYSGVLLRKTASQSITEDFPTGLTWQTASPNNGVWITVPGSTVIIPAGVFRVRMFAAATWGSTLGTLHTLRYSINGAFAGLPVSQISSSVVEQHIGSPVIDVVPGDSLVMGVLHDSGEAVNILTTTTTFGIEAVR